MINLRVTKKLNRNAVNKMTILELIALDSILNTLLDHPQKLLLLGHYITRCAITKIMKRKRDLPEYEKRFKQGEAVSYHQHAQILLDQKYLSR